MNIAFRIIADQSKVRLDRFLSDKYSELSRSKIQSLIQIGSLKLDDHLTKPSLILKGGEVISCDHQEIEEQELIPEKMDLSLIFEDENIAVVNKPAGLVVHPGAGNFSGTLANGLLHHFQSLSEISSIRPGIVHRLDKDTSGVILIAKTDFAHFKIGEQFANHEIRKTYKSLVWGKVENEGEISGLIGRHRHNRKIFSVVKSKGRYSQTKYRLEKELPPFSLITVQPKTGRTHQIRVHMKSIGHPILADEIYAGGQALIKSFHTKYTPILKSIFHKINRMALHAYSLEITHPVSKMKMKWIAPLPEDIKTVITILSDAN